jgi:uncharacterized membrane protein YjgN (DUF898 family)
MSRSDAAVVSRGESLTIEQDAHLWPFLRLSALHGLLNAVTFGVFRFWGRTEVRRQLWDSTYVNDDPLAYEGHGLELLFGFLIRAVAVAAVALVVLFGVRRLGPVAGLVLMAPAYLVLAYGLGFASFAGFLYLATRTEWRGVAFDHQGSPSAYASAFVGHAVLSALTLGWWWPTAQRRLAGMLWSGLLYGERPFRFDPAALRRQPVYGAFAIGWFVSLMVVLFATGVLLGLASGFFPTPSPGEEPSNGQMAALTFLTLVLIGLVAVAFAPYRAARLRTLAAAVRFEGLRFRFKLSGRELARLRASNFVLLTISLGVLSPYAQARTSRFLIDRLRTTGSAELRPAAG